MTRSLQEILCWEFHLSRFCLFYHDWKAFSFTPVSDKCIYVLYILTYNGVFSTLYYYIAIGINIDFVNKTVA